MSTAKAWAVVVHELGPPEIGHSEVKGKKKVRSAVSFHTFRHTCANLLFEAGRNVKQVQAWLGHADPGFTLKTYIHLMDAGVGDAAFLDDAIDAKLKDRQDESSLVQPAVPYS